MAKHFVILSSSYSNGERIALHYTLNEESTVAAISEELQTIRESCGQSVPISTHYIITDSPEWESIPQKDAFFENVKVIKTLEQFTSLIKEDRILRGIDIARYIVSVSKCTQLSLEKMVYMCYADYLCHTKKKLFVDKIYAFKYGPVVESVLQVYRKQKEIRQTSELTSSARSRILFAENGVEKLQYIDETLQKYGTFSAGRLVEITHVENGPWASVSKERYTEIPDEIILEKHYLESDCI